MKKKLLLIFMCLGISFLSAQFTKRTIKQIQQVPLDSLLKADSLGIGANSRWTLQTSPYNNQQVEITALVIIPPRIITYTAHGRAMVVSDTGSAMNEPWSHIFVRYGGSNTSTAEDEFDADGYNSVKAGDIVVMKGTISEFPTTSMNSLTQFAPAPGEPVVILSSGNSLPAPIHKQISDFNIGANPGGKVLTSGGEPLEAQQVMFTNVTVVGNVNTTRGTWAFTDAQGNQFSIYDWSYHFTLDTTAVDRVGNPHDTTYRVPPLGTQVDTIRGFIGTSSGGEASRGYRICPIYPEDVKYGETRPGINTHRRTPVVVLKDSQATIAVKAFRFGDEFGGVPLSGVKLIYKVNNGSWNEISMTAAQPSADSLYSVKIPAQNVGAYVYYFIKATDDSGRSQILANSGNLTQFDTSRGVFFYKVLDRTAQPVLSIRDVQYTPFANGRTPYLGAVDSVGGIVTADTASLLRLARSQGGTTAYYMQSANQPYSGLWFAAPDSVAAKVKNGDSVVVTGTITEFNEVTELFAVTSVRIVSRDNSMPEPLVFLTERFGPGVANGNLNAEPYEGMLVQFQNVTITSVLPVFQDLSQFEVSNSSQPILVARDGRNSYTTDTSSTLPAGTLRLVEGSTIQSLTGILYYNNNRYKVVPRTDADFVGVVTGVKISAANTVPEQFSLSQNYPNPFNPTTTVRYSIPVSGHVTLKVYNVIGQEVATLVNTVQKAASYTVAFDASKLASGVYFYRLSAGNFTQVKKMLMLK